MIERDFLIEKLRTGEVTVKFTKADGTDRIMRCTLQQDIIVPYQKVHGKDTTERTKEKNDDVVSVWDVEKDAWRSFKLSSLTGVECH